MFKRLLIPLDGSSLAESALPYALFLAETFHSTLVLFHATEPHPPATVHGYHHLASADEAKQYLDAIVTRIGRPGLSIETHVHPPHEENIARSIIEHAADLNVQLILLCTHGRSGLRDMLLGSIAQQVIQQGNTPVFIVRPNIEAHGVHKILVPLDSTSVHEPALPTAVEFARACDAAIHLVTVVPTTATLSPEQAASGVLLPSTMEQVLDLAQRGAVEYLQGVKKRLAEDGMPATAQVARGDTATAILEIAEQVGGDLYVIATHGLGKIEAFWAGSVTPRLLSGANAPVLLVRVTGEDAAR